MSQQAGNILPNYTFLPLKNVHFPFLVTWIKAMSPSGARRRLSLLPLLQKQSQYWNSLVTRSWMMEVNRQPAFCVSFDQYHKSEPPENNRLSLLMAPSIQQAPMKVMRAWQAAAIYVFQQENAGWLTAELDISDMEEREAIQRIGFREIRKTASGNSVLYICQSGGLTPVF